jgi:hypothetical protein
VQPITGFLLADLAAAPSDPFFPVQASTDTSKTAVSAMQPSLFKNNFPFFICVSSLLNNIFTAWNQ